MISSAVYVYPSATTTQMERLMTQTAMAVAYRLTEATRQDDARSLKDQFAAAAPFMVATPGLSWKISAIDADRGVGLGLYLFGSEQAARDFEAGELMQSLRRHLGITDIKVTRAPALRDLSVAMGAAQALGLAPPNRSKTPSPALADH
jgi:Putative mono-oxygenase ydhR